MTDCVCIVISVKKQKALTDAAVTDADEQKT